jgi:DNA polymerase-3 subunit delta'
MAFDDIIGHERQKRFLSFLMERGNIPHAFLFCGQEGIGKRQTAMEFTRRLFCQAGTGCGACRSCVKLDRGSHPDLVVVRNEGSIGIDDSRMIAKEVSEHPFEQDKRHIMSTRINTKEAANALLKTLEEPRRKPLLHHHLLSVRYADHPSRCTRVALSPLPGSKLDSTSGLSGIDPTGGVMASYPSQIGSGLFCSMRTTSP